ncbi:unnamed protein product [Cladocopium goreaui]|uniref:Probable mannosyltransferase YUR1 n=1 Tax=Cladocopium goreaui TaxID=2562237 RepID=A0A9P1BZW9_9DINO|nr:unnamed protein product [Cladocopium goreaui]
MVIFNSYATNYQRVKSTITKARPNLKLHGVPQDVYRFHQQLLETSPFLRYVKHFDRWLSESPYQASIAVGALLCGGLCSWNGPKLWELIVITCFSLSAVWLVRFEAERRQLAPNWLAEILLMAVTGCTVALSVHSGFEGSQVLIGSVLGFLAAVYCGVANLTQAAGFLHGMTLTWYLTGSAFGVWVFTAWRQPLLATLAPLSGSYLVVVGLGFLMAKGFHSSLLPRHDEPWSSAALVLLGPLGLHSLPWHGACALLAASLHRCRRQIFAVLVLVAYVILVALGALVAGLDCKSDGKRSDGTDCPQALAVPGKWQWQLLGCSLWAVLAAWSGYRQLSALKNAPRRSGRYMPVDEDILESQVPPAATRLPQPDPYVTRLPQGYGPQMYQPGGLYKYDVPKEPAEYCGKDRFHSDYVSDKSSALLGVLPVVHRASGQNDIEITKLSWFQSPKYQDFFTFLDSVGGFWLYRWGDHAVRTIAIALFLDPTKLMRMRVPYGHQNTCRCGDENVEQVCVRSSSFDWWRCIHQAEVKDLPAGSIVATGDVETVKEEILFGES